MSAVYLHFRFDLPCAGCGADAFEPCLTRVNGREWIGSRKCPDRYSSLRKSPPASLSPAEQPSVGAIENNAHPNATRPEDVALASPVRTLPPSTNGREAMLPFLDALQARRELHGANAQHEHDARRRVKAARSPLVRIEPTRGRDLGPTSPVYVRSTFERQLPGVRHDVGHPRWAKGEATPPDGELISTEASQIVVHEGTPPRHPEGSLRRGDSRMPLRAVSYSLGESDSQAREEAHHTWAASLDPTHSSEPFVDLLDPSRGDARGDSFLSEHDRTRTGREPSHETRGAEHLPVEEAVRRALIHCADLGVPLEALRAPYRPHPGEYDRLMSIRRAVAICLRLEGSRPASSPWYWDETPAASRS